MQEGDRVAEVLGAVSLAAARARGQAAESILGTTILATRLAGLFESEGKTDREIRRCLKRYIARRVWRLLEHQTPQTNP